MGCCPGTEGGDPVGSTPVGRDGGQGTKGGRWTVLSQETKGEATVLGASFGRSEVSRPSQGRQMVKFPERLTTYRGMNKGEKSSLPKLILQVSKIRSFRENGTRESHCCPRGGKVRLGGSKRRRML